MNRPIALGLAPNLEKIDAQAALKLLFSSRAVVVGKENEKLEEWFKNYFSCPYAFSFVSARGGITALLLSQGIGKDDEVLIQAFTCVAVSNAILATGATPVYVDITNTFGIDVEDVKKKITAKTKALILQHTFGIPAFSPELHHLIEEKRLFVIEDVAHSIGGTYKGKKLGTIGDAGVFSLGRDKAFSSVSGGVVITNKKEIGEYMQKYHSEQTYPSRFWTFQQVFHSVSFFFLILPLYNLFIGKIFLVLFQKFHLLVKPVAKNELKRFAMFGKKMPSALAHLALLQLQRLDKFNTYREETAGYYAQELSGLGAKSYSNIPLLRYPFLVRNPVALKRFAKKSGVLLGDWYSHIIDPKGVDLTAIGYKKGSCPQAEYIASHIVNLPTYPTLSRKEREKVVKIIKAYGKS